MKKSQKTLRIENSIKAAMLYIAFARSNSKWKLAFGNGNKTRDKTIAAGNLAQLQVDLLYEPPSFSTWMSDLRLDS